jgi:fatty acid desaturase
MASQQRRRSNEAKSRRLASPWRRSLLALFGLLLLGVAGYGVLSPAQPLDLWLLMAALAFGLLGLDALDAALRCRRSLLGRIGPLP